MKIDDVVGRLDGVFRPGDFDEHDGWDIAFGPGERAALLARGRRRPSPRPSTG